MRTEQAEKRLIVYVPESLEKKVGTKLYGFYKKDTGIFNITGPDASGSKFLGEIVDELPEDHSKRVKLYGVIKEGNFHFFYLGKELRIEYYNLYLNIFSRNKGILETDKMKKKCAVIIGCGSVGSLISLELARSGVGTFFLIDTDILEYHNISRHQCGIHEVGEYKVKVLKQRILDINPKANVFWKTEIIEHISQSELEAAIADNEAIFVSCADNREADVYANMVAARFASPFISIGFWERAMAGEIFYWLPNKGQPCYGCALGSSGRRVSVNHHVYSNQVDIEKVKFEPGISVDINFITCIGIKLILDILNSNDSSYIPRLLNNLRQYTLVANTSDRRIGGEMVEIFSYPLQVTTSLKVSFRNDCYIRKCCRYEE